MEDDVSTNDAFIHKDRHTFRYNQKRDRILGGDGQICLYMSLLSNPDLWGDSTKFDDLRICFKRFQLDPCFRCVRNI